MRQGCFVLFICALVLVSGCEERAKGDFYYFRLMWNQDASTMATVGWSSSKPPSAKQRLHYDTMDHGTHAADYAYSAPISTSNTAFGLNNVFVRLDHLKPKTKYYFVVAENGGASAVSSRFWFETASDDPRDPISIVAGGDSRNNQKPRLNANLLVAKLRPHAVMFGGDMVDIGLSVEWNQWLQDWQTTIAPDGRMTPVIVARGNHESENKILVDIFDTPSEVYYATSLGGSLLRVYTLNSESSIGGDQALWLEKDLASNSHTTWKLAQYHRPMRPHVGKKKDDEFMYKFWAPHFYKYGMNFVVEADAHTVKTTWPLRPSTEPGNELGFVRDDKNGTIFLGEGCWGAPLRKNDKIKAWTRDSGVFNQFNWIFLSQNMAEVRVIKVDNAQTVEWLTDQNRFDIPNNLDIWKPANGDVIRMVQ